ncbi:pyridoxamine 5'-phosphate oxidase family protein [Microlunatus speluncae]|uniref:pyridoxamine 5'-phosphate oxidase family protein n=1 Tax=Microlunatus speluncae TaxID=2594267 RepID=UPI0013757A0B|nr:pyridoxamine 5'-phosphate oxidase family protein [Microlunatus speluncae]
MTETQGMAERVLAGTRYLVLSTADADGRPWATPVWYASDGEHFYWVSAPTSRHSENIAARADVALVIFNSQVPVGSASAYYASATAQQVPPDEVEAGIAIFSAESVAAGHDAWGIDRVTGDSRLRLYRATMTEQWVLAEDGGPDRRLPIEPA